MAANIQVVLREDVAKLGKTGEVVKVKPGFARNFLLPRGLAVLATKANIAHIEHERAAAIARAAKLRSSAEAVAQALSAVTVEIAKTAGDEGKLYGSVTHKEVAEALHAKGFTVDRKQLSSDGLKALGEHAVSVKLSPEVSATVKVVIVKK